jgi:hypothetical protein
VKFSSPETQMFYTCLYFEETGNALGPEIAENDEVGMSVTLTANLHTGNLQNGQRQIS